MKHHLRKVIQTGLLILFLFLIITGRVQLWMGLFLVGIAASFIFGRFYCGWICSINTVLEWVTAFKKKHGIKNRNIPEFVKKPFARWVLIAAFIGIFLFTVKTGKKLPVLPFLFMSGIVLTFFYHEELWHRFLCPYGSLLSLSSTTAKKGMSIDEEKCVNCGACARVCPAISIDKTDTHHIINKNDCLVCMKCEVVCKPDAISYK